MCISYQSPDIEGRGLHVWTHLCVFSSIRSFYFLIVKGCHMPCFILFGFSQLPSEMPPDANAWCKTRVCVQPCQSKVMEAYYYAAVSSSTQTLSALSIRLFSSNWNSGSWKRVNCGKLNSFTPLLFTQFLSMRAEDKSFFREMVPSCLSIDSAPCLNAPKDNYLVLGPSEDSCQFLTSSPFSCPRWKAKRGNGVKQEQGGSWPQN